MYKALAYKELRETAWIGAIVFLAMMLVVLNQMGVRLDPSGLFIGDYYRGYPFPPRKIPFVHTGLHYSLVWIATIGAVALGLRQVLGESAQNNWLFLLHRPVSRENIISTKLAVGGTLLLSAILLPLIILAIWAATPGTHASPFDWRMTAHPLRVCCAATTIYIAAFLCGVRVARWYGSRLFPLVPALVAMLWVFFIDWWPITGWLVVFLADALYLVALRLALIEREYP